MARSDHPVADQRWTLSPDQRLTAFVAGIHPRTLVAYMSGAPLSRSQARKLHALPATRLTAAGPRLPLAAFGLAPAAFGLAPPTFGLTPAKQTRIQTLLDTHALYRDLGSLRAVSTRLGITRQAVHQRLLRGAALGLFPYTVHAAPRRAPLPPIARDTLLAEYAQLRSLRRLAAAHDLSKSRLRRLLASLGLDRTALHAAALRGRQAQCLAEYRASSDGHLPSSYALAATRAGRNLLARITRAWTGFRAFRATNGIAICRTANPQRTRTSDPPRGKRTTTRPQEGSRQRDPTHDAPH
jgi:hypothetical protein